MRHQTTAMRPLQGRELIDHVRYWDQSIGYIYEASSVTIYHYRSKRADMVGLEKRIEETCETRGRNGYRWVWVLLRREGEVAV